MSVRWSYRLPPQPDNMPPYLLPVNPCWRLPSVLWGGSHGNRAPKSSRGCLAHASLSTVPGTSEQRGCAWKTCNRLTGRGILSGFAPRSCQFRSPGHKSFYLLQQMLCRTKCQVDFKAGDVRRALGCHGTAASSCPIQHPSEPFPDSQPLFSPRTPLPLKTCCPLTTQEAQCSKTRFLVTEIKIILPCLVASCFCCCLLY